MKIYHRIFLALIALFFTISQTYSQSPAKEIYNAGINYAVKGDFNNAKKEFEKALTVDSLYTSAQLSLKTINDILLNKIKKETGVYVFKGVQYDDQGKYEQAINEFTKAIEINPGYADVYNKRGISYYNREKYDLAIRDYNKAIEINPKYAEAFNNRGIVYYQQEKYDLATSNYTKAIEIDPKYAKAYHNRGLVYFLYLKDTDKGCADWLKACELGECTNYKMAKEKKLCN